ncbi:MAG: LysM peptidoglycan-binding domain-containing protein [Polyangiaceae bacterium]|nr:LysM peptidoglycan-binding domain-containing protein [Polyangiaceae bacterium]
MFPKLLPGLTPGWVWEPPAGAAPAPPEQDDGALPPGPVPDTPPGATDPEAAHAEWLRSLALPGFPVRLEPAVVKYLEFYRDDARGKAIARVWAKKSGRFAPALKAALVRAGLPADLVWLSLIESGHNPTIVSSAGAAGLWQFMPDSARAYGLVVDRWVDERYDPERITEAAVRYLGDLHQRFGTWELAMGAYNMGHGGMARVIQKFNSNDFWELARLEAALPWETTLYVPKIFALAIVMNNLRAFGLEDVTPDPPEAFDTLLVGPGTPLETVAAAAGTSLSELRRLNPSYLAARVPPASPSASRARWRVRVPAGSGESAGRALARAGDPEREHDVHVVRFGDTVASIAARRRTTESAIRKLNQIGRDEVLDAGTVLLVPRSDEAEFAADVEPVVVVPAQDIRYADRDRVFYRVRANDTLARVAHAFGVRRSELLAWNALDPAARLQPDMMLQVWVRRGASLGHVRHVRETDTRVLVAGTPEFIDYFESLQGRQRLVVTVAVGDTLESIGRRHGMSVGWMERINRMPRTKRLAPGATVIVYVKAPKPAAPAPEGAAAPAEAAAQAPGDAPAAVGGADAPAGATSDTQEPEAPPQGS